MASRKLNRKQVTLLELLFVSKEYGEGEPVTGLELAKRSQIYDRYHRVPRFAVYSELCRLVAKGLVRMERTEIGEPVPRCVYFITDKGKEVYEGMKRPPGARVVIGRR